jgi:YihY family inner membrane protein
MALASTSLVALVQGLIADAFHSLRLVKLLSGMVIKILTLPLTVLIFFTLYFALPHRRIRARQAWSAAIFAAVLWELARMLFFWWVFPWLNFKETYGPFYVSVSLVMWAFVSSFVLLLGANLSAQDLLASRPGPEGRGGPDTPGPRAGEPADRGAGPFKRKDGI